MMSGDHLYFEPSADVLEVLRRRKEFAWEAWVREPYGTAHCEELWRVFCVANCAVIEEGNRRAVMRLSR